MFTFTGSTFTTFYAMGLFNSMVVSDATDRMFWEAAFSGSVTVSKNGDDYITAADSLGRLGDDVWVAHGVHLDAAARARLAATRTGVAHCPSSNGRLGAGTAPVAELLEEGVSVGLGVDGTASNESGQLGPEMRSALLTGRARSGPTAVTTRQALMMATMGGARCLGRQGELGSLETGKLADIALWRLDTAAHAGISDPVAALVLGSLPPLELLLVGGRPLVEGGRFCTLDAGAVAREVATACRKLESRGPTGPGRRR